MDDDLTFIGEHYGYGRVESRPFGIDKAARRQGLHLIGQAGTGKSSLMLSMLCQDIARGEGVTLIDPHGLTAEKLLDHIPQERVRDVCYFNVADLERPIGFNILETSLPPEKRHLAVSAVVSAFCGIWNLTPERAPRLLNILKHAVAALLETPDATLLSLEHLLTDEAYRVRVVTRHSNPAVRRYWLETFDTKDARYRSEAIDPVLTRVSDFGIVPLMQRIVGQAKSGFDPRAIMDGKKILIANLDIGQIGEENTQLLGALLLTRYELTARSRSQAPGVTFPDHYLYVDEFHRFPNERWPNTLSGIRAYGLCLTLAHQYGEQLSNTTRSAVYGSVGSTIASAPGLPTRRSWPSTTAASSPSRSSPASTTARSTCGSWSAASRRCSRARPCPSRRSPTATRRPSSRARVRCSARRLVGSGPGSRSAGASGDCCTQKGCCEAGRSSPPRARLSPRPPA